MIKYFFMIGFLALGTLSATQMVSTPPAGSQLLYTEDGAQVEKREDGSKLIKTPDGATIEVRADGSKTIRKADGTTIEVPNNR